MDWFFSDLLESGILDLTNVCQRDAVVFFADILQKDLDKAREHWNSYKIRRSHHTTIQGVPDILYFLPEQAGEGRDDCLVNVPLRTLEEVKQEIIVVCLLKIKLKSGKNSSTMSWKIMDYFIQQQLIIEAGELFQTLINFASWAPQVCLTTFLCFAFRFSLCLCC